MRLKYRRLPERAGKAVHVWPEPEYGYLVEIIRHVLKNIFQKGYLISLGMKDTDFDIHPAKTKQPHPPPPTPPTNPPPTFWRRPIKPMTRE